MLGMQIALFIIGALCGLCGIVFIVMGINQFIEDCKK